MVRVIPILVVLLWTGALGCYTRTSHDAPPSNDELGAEAEADWGEEFVARVYHVEGPDVVRAHGSFDLGIFDGLGCPNVFVRDEVTWQDDEATVVVIGRRPPEPIACPQDAPPPRARLLTITPPPYERVEVVFNAQTEYEIKWVVDLTDRRSN
jgi:hypothetical protein